MAKNKVSVSTVNIKLSDIKSGSGQTWKTFTKNIKKLASEARIEIEIELKKEYVRQLSRRSKMNGRLRSEFNNIVRFESDKNLSRITEIKKKMKGIGATSIKKDDFFIVKARLLNKKARSGRLSNMSISSFHGLWYMHEYNETRGGKKTIHPKGKLLAYPHRDSGLPSDASPRDYEGHWVDVGLANMSVFISSSKSTSEKPKIIENRAPKVKSNRRRLPRLGGWSLEESKKSLRSSSIRAKKQAVITDRLPSGETVARFGENRKSRVLFVGIPSLPVKDITRYPHGGVGPFRKAVDVVGKNVSTIVQRNMKDTIKSMPAFMKNKLGLK